MINFDKLTLYKTHFATYFDDRYLTILETLEENDPITIKECAKLLKISDTRTYAYIKESERDYIKGKWSVNLKDLLFSNPHNAKQKLLFKKDVAEVLKFIQHREILAEIRKNRVAYRKAMNEKYGTITYSTKKCIESDYNCEKCPNLSVCNIANNKPFVKRLSIIMAMLEHSNYDPKPCFKIFELEEKLKKAEAKIINLKIKISEQQTLLLKAAKEIKTHYEEVA